MMRHIQIKKRRCVPLLALALGALMAGTVACWWNVVPTPTPRSEVTVPTPTPSTEVLVPTPTPRSQVAQNTIWSVSPSIEEQILTSSVIVRASLLSAAATETVPSDEGVASTFRPVQELSFRVHEYLKGSGPAEVLVALRGRHTYLTAAEALQAATESVSVRNTTWDGREGVLFLNPLRSPYSPAGDSNGSDPGSGDRAPTAPAFAFTLSNPVVQSEWDYAVDTLSRSWLPARDDSGASGTGDRSSDAAATQVFITDGAKSPPPVTSLADLRSSIAEIDTMVQAGTTTEYMDCIYFKITRERHYRDDPYIPYEYEARLTSGFARGTLLFTNPDTDPKYHNYWLSGPDMEHFQALIVDDDTNPSNGYDNTLSTARPLPAGGYRVYYYKQHYRNIPCNFRPDNTPHNWTATVTAPTGTLHEAFFDPGAAGGAVGFSSATGSMEPAGFTVGGAATAIGGLIWQDGSVVLTLAPYSLLTGYGLDFIALDGSVSLTLTGATATANSAHGTLTWPVAEQPWRDGDQLMLRIRESE